MAAGKQDQRWHDKGKGPNFGQILNFGQGFLNSVRLYFRVVRRYKCPHESFQIARALRLT
jgi:hypothetical protein